MLKGDRSRPSVLEAAALGEVLAAGAVDELLHAALLLVVVVAAATVDLADGASVSLAVGGQLATVAASNDLVAGMDADQYLVGEGPCVSAATTGVLFRTDSIAKETRWPAFVPRAAERGIRAIISTPLTVLGRSVGALNICSRTAWAFASPRAGLATVLAAQASAILSARMREERDVAELSQTIQGALSTRRAVMLAQGVLMEREGISADEAHRVLRSLSRASTTGIARQAMGIVASVPCGPAPTIESR